MAQKQSRTLEKALATLVPDLDACTIRRQQAVSLYVRGMTLRAKRKIFQLLQKSSEPSARIPPQPRPHPESESPETGEGTPSAPGTNALTDWSPHVFFPHFGITAGEFAVFQTVIEPAKGKK